MGESGEDLRQQVAITLRRVELAVSSLLILQTLLAGVEKDLGKPRTSAGAGARLFGAG